MADKEIPENLDLRFIAAQNMRILRELGDMREQGTDMRSQMTDLREQMTEMRGHTQHIPQIRADIAELQIGQAALSEDLKIVKRNVEDLKETGSIVEGRLVRIEKQLGYLKA
jgi:hypothetical protein